MDSSSSTECSDAGMQVRGLQREDIQAAIAKAAELRALHAALLQGGGGGTARLHSGGFPPSARGVNHLPIPEDYPVFTPSYEEESLPGYPHVNPENINLRRTWNVNSMEEEEDGNMNLGVCLDNMNLHKLSISNNDPKFSPATDRLCRNYVAANVLKSSSRAGLVEDRTSNLDQRCLKKVKSTGASSINLEKSVKMNTRHRGAALSWLFPKFKKKSNPKMSPPKMMMESENMSQFLKHWGVLSLESLKKELLEANECKDAALAEVSEMRLSFRELQQKLLSLETYCEDLKRALKHPVHAKSSYQDDENSKSSKRMKANGGSKNNSMPVSEEVMVEGFLQVVSEARLSVKQFCKAIIHHIEESGDDLSEKLNFLHQQHQIASTDKNSKEVICHLEALINQSLYRDFENCVFQESGSPKFLDPKKECRENFSSFVALRNLSYNDVLQKGTKHYSEDFGMFCDRKMSCIVSLLNWPSPWPEQLLQCFFIAAKCIWLLHLLAFSFSPPLRILRVDRDRDFDSIYMEDIPFDRHAVRVPSAQVKIMVMPGFYILDKMLRCRVLCRDDSLP